MTSQNPCLAMETLAVHAGERRPGPEGSVVFPIYQRDGLLRGARHRLPRHQVHPPEQHPVAGVPPRQARGSGDSGSRHPDLLRYGRADDDPADPAPPGDHFLAGDCLYGGTHDFITHHAEHGWSYTFVDPQRPQTWAAARTPHTRLFLAETITNPLMRVPRLAEIVTFAQQHNLVTVIDNTFASPVNFRPLSVGFDLCCHSATKYLNGHSDLVAGCILGSAERVNEIRKNLNHYGGSLDPHAGFLLARGLKTLALRVAAQNANAMALARFLAEHLKVSQVNCPGLPSHPDHPHAAQLLRGFGGMLSLRLRDGASAAQHLLDALHIPYAAPSLGGVETLITRPAMTSHAGMSPQDRQRLGVTDDLVRVSCGIESAHDLIADFDHALKQT